MNVGGWTELDRAHLPLLDLCVIRTMAADFSPHRTDGFLLRHFSLLCDAALHTVALLFACVEALGALSQQIRYVLVVVIPKTTSG